MLVRVIPFQQTEWKAYESFILEDLEYLLKTEGITSLEEEFLNHQNLQEGEASYGIFNEFECIGRISVNYIERDYLGLNGQISIWIGKNHRNKGYAKEALSQILDLMFEQGFDVLLYNTYSFNQSSIKVAEGLGFRFIEEFVEEEISPDPIRQYAMSSYTWETKKKSTQEVTYLCAS